MNPQIDWEPQPLMVRGGAIGAVVHIDELTDLGRVLGEVWFRVASTIEALINRESIPVVTIAVESWQDTGRIIFILRQKRDLARIVLKIPILEESYFRHPRSDRFEDSYKTLHDNIVQSLAESLDEKTVHRLCASMSGYVLKVRVYDCDDLESAVALYE